MRTDYARRLKALEGSLRRRNEDGVPRESILWLDETYGAHVGWTVLERLEKTLYPERAGVIVDFLEAAEAVDPDAAAKFFEHARRFE